MMEEKQTMTSKELESELQSLRAQERISNILLSACGVGLLIACLLKNIPLVVICIVGAFFCAIRSNDASGKIKKTLSENITRSVIREVLGDDVEYNPWGTISPGSMVFPFTYNTTSGSDHIMANYNGLEIELGDIELQDEGETTDEETGVTTTSRHTWFKGQWLTCDFGKKLSGQVYISQRSKKDAVPMKSNVKMDNEQFNKRFCIRADDPQEAYYILTPHMMEYILTIADNSGGTLYMSFLREGKLHVAVQTGRDFFELGKEKVKTEKLCEKFKSELRWFTDIVDTLRVEDSLYKKELNE